jgi:hypothetical protein
MGRGSTEVLKRPDRMREVEDVRYAGGLAAGGLS